MCTSYIPVDYHLGALVILAGAGHLVPGVPRLDRPVVGDRPNEHLATQLDRAPHVADCSQYWQKIGKLPRTSFVG